MREWIGSGGPRGLQILLSGAKTTRGGFDSHTFPPIHSSVSKSWSGRAAGVCKWSSIDTKKAPGTGRELSFPLRMQLQWTVRGVDCMYIRGGDNDDDITCSF